MHYFFVNSQIHRSEVQKRLLYHPDPPPIVAEIREFAGSEPSTYDRGIRKLLWRFGMTCSLDFA